jgi:carboxypeptidase T
MDQYLNVTEVESALIGLATNYPELTQLITLEYKTYEGRTCRALRIGTGSDGTKTGVLFIGGVHAREWGSCEICINFAADVLEAYTKGTGLVYGGKSFPSKRIKEIVERFHVFVFPLVNPDGRHYSQTTLDTMWRKNRKPLPSGNYGVDINRNYDFLWDFPSFFNTLYSNVDVYTSTEEWADTYHGEAAFSEQETKNVLWMLDTHPKIRWFMDIHSFGQHVYYPWSDDENQCDDPAMNFRNPVYNKYRGEGGDNSYREYISPDDFSRISGLAARVRDAIQAVRGTSYTAEQSFYLYPTAGASIDYVFSRHIVDTKNISVDGLMIEWGTSFHPPWEEMKNIILDVTAGLIEFCPDMRPPPPTGLRVKAST